MFQYRGSFIHTPQKIIFVIRQDAGTKPGGDADLAQAYARLLQQAGFPASVAASNSVQPQESDYLVLFNLDQPFEAYCIAQKCVKKRVPFAIYTLHHKREWTEKFLKNGTSGPQRMVALALGGSAIHYETVVGLLRRLRHSSPSQILSLRSAGQMMNYLLSRADAVVVSCQAEAACIESDLKAKLRRVAVIPHCWQAVDAPANASSATGYATDILCAGRVEPRKNQLSLARYIQSSTDRSLLFIGKKNTRHAAYISEFEEVVSSCPRITWLDHVTKEDLRRYLVACRTYINVSWFEVFSLVDLIALSAGGRCIFSKGSYLFDELGASSDDSDISFVDPSNLSELSSLLASSPKRGDACVSLPHSLWPDPRLLVREWMDIIGLDL
ncbi:MAG: glycosyltransferase [Acidobacteriaceae bacterium]